MRGSIEGVPTRNVFPRKANSHKTTEEKNDVLAEEWLVESDETEEVLVDVLPNETLNMEELLPAQSLSPFAELEIEMLAEMPQKHGERKWFPKKPSYNKIKINREIFPVRKVSEEVPAICDCLPSDNFPCGPDSNCINRSLFIECSVECSKYKACLNQRFAKRSYSKVELKYFNMKGWGLIAKENILCDSFIIEYVGQIVDTDEFNRRFSQMVAKKTKNVYIMALPNGNFIDADTHGNEARFINHSCDPNCVPYKWSVKGQTRIGIFAKVDIKKVGSTLLCRALFVEF